MGKKQCFTDRRSLQAIADEIRHELRDAWYLAEFAKTPAEEIEAIEALREAMKKYESLSAGWVWLNFLESRAEGDDGDEEL